MYGTPQRSRRTSTGSRSPGTVSSPSSGRSDAAATSRSWSTKSLMAGSLSVTEPASASRCCRASSRTGPRTPRRARASSSCVPCLDEPAGVEHEHAIGVLGGRQPVRDRDHGPPGGQPPQRLGGAPLGRRIDRARRLVQDQQARVGDLRARERDELALADGEGLAPLADRRVEPVGQRVDPVGRGPAPRTPSRRRGRSRRAGRTGRSRGRWRRTGTRPAGPSGSAARRDAGDTRAGRRRRPRSGPPRDRPAGPGAWRTSSCPPPVSPTIATCAPASIVERDPVQDRAALAVRVLDVLRANRERRPRGSSTPGDPARRSRRGGRGPSRIFRQPAIAVCVSRVDLREIGEHVQEDVRQEHERGHAGRT